MREFVIYAHKKGDSVVYIGCGRPERAYDFYRRNNDWKRLFSDGSKPEVILLDTVFTNDRKQAEKLELHYDTIFRRIGAPLVNRVRAKYWLGKKRSEIDPETMKKLWKAGHSPEARKKQSEAKRGRKLSDEHKRKISDSLKGRVQSEETRIKIAKTRKERGLGGRKPGYKHKPESIEKMRKAAFNRKKKDLDARSSTVFA